MTERVRVDQWWTYRTLLSVGIVLSTMTQLRFPGFPVGPGEFLLIVYVIWAQARYLKSDSLALRSFAGRAVIWYWVISALILAIGFGVGYWAGVTDWLHARHDAIAYTFMAIICGSIVQDVSSSDDATNEICRFTVTTFAICGALWVCALWVPHIGEMSFWYGGVGVRYIGLSVNPNQNALLLIGAPFLLLFCLEKMGVPQRNLRGGVIWLFSALAIAAGWGTGSGALRMIWLAFIPLILMFSLFFSRHSTASRDAQVYFYSVLALAACLTFLSTLDLTSVGGTYGGESGGVRNSDVLLMAGNNEWFVRFTLWRNAWDAIKVSPVFGLGPGAFSGISTSFEGLEAHNSLIDWATNAGLSGAVLLLAAMSFLFWSCLRMKSIGLGLLMLALAAFSMAHHVLRHPLLGALLVLVALAASHREAGAVQRYGAQKFW